MLSGKWRPFCLGLNVLSDGARLCHYCAYMPNKVWDEITDPFSNFKDSNVEVQEWISNFIPHFVMDVMTKINLPSSL